MSHTVRFSRSNYCDTTADTAAVHSFTIVAPKFRYVPFTSTVG